MLSAVPQRHGCARCSMPAQCSRPHRRWDRPPRGSPRRTAGGDPRRGRAGHGPMRNRAPSCSAGTRPGHFVAGLPKTGTPGRWLRVVAGARTAKVSTLRIASRATGPAHGWLGRRCPFRECWRRSSMPSSRCSRVRRYQARELYRWLPALTVEAQLHSIVVGQLIKAAGRFRAPPTGCRSPPVIFCKPYGSLAGARRPCI